MRKRKKNDKIAERKARMILLVIVVGVILLSLALFIANVNSPPAPGPR